MLLKQVHPIFSPMMRRFEIRTEPNDVGAIRDELSEKGYNIISSDSAYIPSTYTRLDDPEDMKNGKND